MSKKNKCVGLDCEMCDNTKCPNEEKEKIIDGIDVSESVLTATNNNIYYSQIAVDELQNNIKHLQEENEELKEEKDGMQIVISNYIEHTTKYRQTLEEIRNIAETPIIADKNRFNEITNKINEALNEQK